MSKRILGSLIALGAVMLLTVGSASGAAGTQTLLHFRIGGAGEWSTSTTLSKTPAPATEVVFAGALYNTAAQFGKAIGAPVGRILLDCTVVVPTPTDGVCTGMIHLPSGFVTFAGNGPFTTYTVDHYAVTGGDGPYSNDRGEITNVRQEAGGQLTVALTSP